MAPKLEVEERQDLGEDRVQHKRSKSESYQGLETPQHAESFFHGYHRRTLDPKEQIDLTEDRVPGDRFYQRIHDEEAHSESLDMQPELYNKDADIVEKINVKNKTESSSKISGGKVLVPIAHLERLQDGEATSKQELRLERDAHSNTKAMLHSTTTALEAVEKELAKMTRSHTVVAALLNDARQELKKDQDYHQSIVLAKDEEMRAMKDSLESVCKKSDESLKAIRMEADDAIQQRDEAIRFHKALDSQITAVRKEKEEHVLRMQEELDSKICALEANQQNLAIVQGKLTANRAKANSAMSKLREEIETANEDHEASKELHEAQKTLNRTLENKNKLLEKRSSEAKEKIKHLQSGSSSLSSQLRTRC